MNTCNFTKNDKVHRSRLLVWRHERQIVTNRRAAPGCDTIDIVGNHIHFISFILRRNLKHLLNLCVFIAKVKSGKLIEWQEFYSTSPQTFGTRLVCLSCCQLWYLNTFPFFRYIKNVKEKSTLRYLFPVWIYKLQWSRSQTPLLHR